jgi:uncharacterized protein YndB with AHSA1/START domain
MATTESTKPASRQVGAMTLTLKSDLEIELTRVFNAPRRLVFEAHSKCEHVRHWWGTRGDTMTVCNMDFRPGGTWRYVVRNKSGKEHGFGGVFREIVPPERFVWTFGFDGMPGQPGVEIYSFEERDGKTTLTTYAKFDSIEQRDGVIASGMERGAAEMWDRLEEFLQTMA